MADKLGNTLLRWVTLPIGIWMLVYGLADVLSVRARYASSSPEISASLGSLPSTVTVRFGAELDPESELSVYATGVGAGTEKISSQAILDPNDSERRSLTVSLRPMARQGTYSVDWRTKAIRGREVVGYFYFAVGMPTPTHLKFFEDDLRHDESAPNSPNSAVVAGLLLIAIGLLAPMFRSDA